MSIAKRFAELALARFQKKEPETPEYTVACQRIIEQMHEGIVRTRTPEAHEEFNLLTDDEVNAELDRHYSRTLRDD